MSINLYFVFLAGVLGLLMGYLFASVLGTAKGTIRVVETEKGTTYRLELDIPVEDLPKYRAVTFKVSREKQRL